MANYKVTKTTIQEEEKKEKKMCKEKPNASLPQISEDEYKKKINEVFKEQKIYFSIIDEAVSNLTAKGKGELGNLVEAIRNGIKPEFKRDSNGKIISAEFGSTLSDEELENFVVYLPVEMFNTIEFIQRKALDAEYSKYMAELDISDKLLKMTSGTVQEKQRAAELQSIFSSMAALIKKQVYNNLRMELEAANRIYEALKKVLQARIDDKKIFGKQIDK